MSLHEKRKCNVVNVLKHVDNSWNVRSKHLLVLSTNQPHHLKVLFRLLLVMLFYLKLRSSHICVNG